ncbi:MAG: MCE family protein [Aphanothece sp. CMT-3BRIN-NPC111]|jgi:phospholipid/cholesterol/gamma-HCH transport system substrate-binding protein|nr:MCE family protein [Aphanothece sp. CMT-3BRIN-NPC111]
MRSRTVREGSVGLLILLGIALFGGLILWLRGLSPGNRTFKVIVDFANVSGMQTGATVRYRGVNVGKISEIAPGPNGVAVTIELAPDDLVIPRDVLVEANQSGLIGETYLEITPRGSLPVGVKVATPNDPKCNPQLIVCNKTRLQGQIGASSEELIRSTIRFANTYTDPNFVANLNAATRNTAIAAAEVAKLSRDFSGVAGSIKQELRNFSATTNSLTGTASQTANQVGFAANRIANTADKFGNIADQFGGTANQIGSATNQFGQTSAKFNQLANSLNGLVVENRTTLVSTLNNFSEASAQLRDSVSGLKPTLTQVNSTFEKVNSGQILSNLETLSANAAEASANAAKASANLRDISTSLNDPRNLVLLQQTLDSARATFENTQKITSDLDDLTGDPGFRDNLRNLVNGLGKLVSSTQQLEQQVEIAQVLEPVSATMNKVALKTSLTNITEQELLQASPQQVVPNLPSMALTGASADNQFNMPAVERSPQPPADPEIGN